MPIPLYRQTCRTPIADAMLEGTDEPVAARHGAVRDTGAARTADACGGRAWP